MKQKVQLVTKMASLINLKTAYMYGASFVILANLVGVILTIYLNIGVTEDASAKSPDSRNSYLQVTACHTEEKQFVADKLTGDISDFQKGKTIMIYKSHGENATLAASSSIFETVAESYDANAGEWELAVVSSISGSGPYTITVSSLSNNYTSSKGLQLVSVAK